MLTAVSSRRRTGSPVPFLVLVFLLLAVLPNAELHAQCEVLCDASATFDFVPGSNVNVSGDTAGLSKCLSFGVLQYCEEPILLGVTYSLADPSCDPFGPMGCDIVADSSWHFRGNGSNVYVCGGQGASNAAWIMTPNRRCGFTLGHGLDTDLGTVRSRFSSTCQSAGSDVVTAYACPSSPCQQSTQVTLDIRGNPLCNPTPSGCGAGDPGAGMCCFGPGGAAAPDGSAPGFPVPATNARFVYQAGGVGHPGSPGASTWIADSGLGRYWIHEYATRIVSSTPAVAWLITPGGTFRRFTDTNADNLYDEAAPSDEFRTLELDVPAADQWSLTDLVGTQTVFDTDGKWLSTTDRLGNAYTATYDVSGLLETVSFPDGRQEVFSYTGGRLASIQQVGLDDDGSQSAGSPADCSSESECRTWFFTWSGDDLQAILYPDDTIRAFTYDDPMHPGYMTRRELISNGDTGPVDQRVEAAWQYTSGGRILRTWAGSTSFTTGVDRYEFSYDDETQPTEVTVTDPYGQVAIYEIGYDDASLKPRLESVTGQCPSCGGPDDRYEYTSGHELLPSARIDGNGNRTELTYDANGMVTASTEAVGTSEVRVTNYGYDMSFPGLLTFEQRPSVDGVGFRETTWVYDGSSGVLLSMTTTGDETTYDANGDGTPEGSFTLPMTYSGHNAAGQPGTIDPPGYGTTDQTTFSYSVPGRNGLLPDSRTDPLVGTTTYDYDGLNRRATQTDPNGVVTETLYDEHDRVDLVTMAAGTGGALVTDYEYDDYGDLAAVVHPRGNVTAYVYDDAGRLTDVVRQQGPALADGDERVHYVLDDYGQRERVEQQVRVGGWQTRMATAYDYSSRCYLDRVIHNPDHGADEITEYAYDCNRNLTAVWDAEHPSAGQTAAPTQVYDYDALDRLIELRQPWVPGTDCRGPVAPAGCAVTSYAYDVQDHLTMVTDGEESATSYDYSDRDLLIFEQSPVSGLSSHGYNDHAQLVTTTDARGVTVDRLVDELDRVTLVDYTDASLDVAYTYDTAPSACTAGSFAIGRLASITRNGASVDYCYDEHGRTTRDGELTYGYDDNGNLSTIGYPGGVAATYTYDFADRQVGLSVTTPTVPSPATDVVQGATYLPNGPLNLLTLGNGTSETRVFDERYFPEEISLTAPRNRTWTYDTDAVGNITEIVAGGDCPGDVLLTGLTVTGADTRTSCAALEAGPNVTVAAGGDLDLTAATRVVLKDGFAVEDGGTLAAGTDPSIVYQETKTYAYQDTHHFLTSADGPWGSLAWTYDRIGNRLSETRNGLTDTYAYTPNGSSGNTALLEQITLAAGAGTRDYFFGPAGHQETVNSNGNVVTFAYDQEGRLELASRTGGDTCPFEYDGRSYLHQAGDLGTVGLVQPTYDSAGLLHVLLRQEDAQTTPRRYHVFYLAGRPVAQLATESGQADQWWYLTTDHLGTPLVSAAADGTELWDSALEPFGEDGAAGAGEGASANEVFLRFPGQWDDEVWQAATMGGTLYYNLFRFYEQGVGRYTRPDPIRPVRSIDYVYSPPNPLRFIDPLGLQQLERFPSLAIPCVTLPNPPSPTCCSWSQGRTFLADIRFQISHYCNNKAVTTKTRPGGSVDTTTYESPSVLGGNFPSPWYRDQGDPCVNWCICEHERRHNAIKNIAGPIKHLSLYDQLTPNGRECDALLEEFKCLGNAITAAQSGVGLDD